MPVKMPQWLARTCRQKRCIQLKPSVQNRTNVNNDVDEKTSLVCTAHLQANETLG